MGWMTKRKLRQMLDEVRGLFFEAAQRADEADARLVRARKAHAELKTLNVDLRRQLSEKAGEVRALQKAIDALSAVNTAGVSALTQESASLAFSAAEEDPPADGAFTTDALFARLRDVQYGSEPPEDTVFFIPPPADPAAPNPAQPDAESEPQE